MTASLQTPLVSVIMPVYNVEDYLAAAIESVLQQDFPSIELILVNDGSTDTSDIICRHYQQKDERITYLYQKNSGVSIARNYGLSHAKGAYVFFMDSDDTIDKNFIRSSYEIAQQNDSDIVVIGEYFMRRLPNPPALPTCAQLIRLSFLNQYPDIRFPEGIQPCEDGLFSHQLLALTQKVAGNPQGVYYYRQHEKQNHRAINKNTEKVVLQIPRWLELLENFYTQHALFESRALHLAQFIEHEPFEFRYISMPLNAAQKAFLHELLKTFMHKNVFPYLKKQELASLSKPFLAFLKADTHQQFDRYYARYKIRRRKLKRWYIFLAEFVFIKKLKIKLRENIRKKFDE